jgi:hypothetical protein
VHYHPPVTTPDLPTTTALRPLVLKALESRGGTATTADIRSQVERFGAFTDDQLAVRHRPNAPGSELHYRLRWTLVDLRRRGLIERRNPRLWALAPQAAER